MDNLKFFAECLIKTSVSFIVSTIILIILTATAVINIPFSDWYICFQIMFILWYIMTLGVAILWCTEDIK